MRGLFTLLIATIAALVGGVIGFQLGITSNIGAAGGTVVWHAGFPFFGWFFFPLFFFLFIGLLAFAFGGRRRGWGGGPGWGNGYGPGSGPMSTDDPRRQWIADAHRRLHEEEARGTGTTPPTAPPTATERLTHNPLQAAPGRYCPPRRLGIAGVPVRTILVIEDEPQIAALVRDYLEHAGFAVLTAGDGAGGLALARARRPDAVVLDLGLPKVDGLDVVRSLRRDSVVPIVIVTARGDEVDRITGLELGADDYVVKPFSPKELVARVRAVLRRAEAQPTSDERIVAGDLELDLARRRVTAAGHRVPLTPTEFGLLVTLAREPGRVWTRSQLLDAVHGFSLESYERAIDGHVRNLRRKLEAAASGRSYVRTVHGVGYALEEPAG